MDCPACGHALKEIVVDDLAVDVCEGGCGGIWFDRLELKKVDEQHEATGLKLLDVPCDPNVVVDHDARRKCPRCEDMIMMRHFFSIKRSVEVDECPQCAGFWLDAGELKAIRDEFATEGQRNAAAEAGFAQQFDRQLAEMRAKDQEGHERARGIAKMFRFLFPSTYIPGKQKWGMF